MFPTEELFGISYDIFRQIRDGFWGVYRHFEGVYTKRWFTFGLFQS